MYVWVSLIFIFNRTKGFQPGALLKMPSSPPSMEIFGVDIQKYISLKQAKTDLSKNNKNTLKNAGFEGNFKYKDAVCFTRDSL